MSLSKPRNNILICRVMGCRKPAVYQYPLCHSCLQFMPRRQRKALTRAFMAWQKGIIPDEEMLPVIDGCAERIRILKLERLFDRPVG